MSDLLLIPDPEHRARLFAALAESGPFTIVDVGERSESRRYLDSFDWRLTRAGQALCLTAENLRLERLRDGAPRGAVPAQGPGLPRFAADLPAGPLRDEVARRLKIRALVHRVTVVTGVRIWEVRDEKDRIALRLEETTWRPERGKPPNPALTTLALRAVKRFPDLPGRARALCRAAQLAAVRTPPPVWAFQAAGLEPGGYVAKPHIPLDEDLDAREAVRLLCRRLLATMLQNEEGLRRDWDTEFLHDFRVAIRRTRALLGQARSVLPADGLPAFRHDFKALGRMTGPLRDLDVHLLDEERYRVLLPGFLRPGLDSLFARLGRQRQAAHDEVVDVLDSRDYRDLIRRWTAYLAPAASPAHATGGPSEESVRSFACRRILRQHRRILRRGKKIHRTSPASSLHRLRIECKKLRYLLELFADLFPSREIKNLVGHLKQLQDHLGEFNDLSVQQRRLRTDLATLPATDPAAPAEAAAIGGLLAVLAARQVEVRDAFAATFAVFTRKSITRRFTRLCGSSGDS